MEIQLFVSFKNEKQLLMVSEKKTNPPIMLENFQP